MSSCSVAALRYAFRPFPVRPLSGGSSTPEPPAKRARRLPRQSDDIRSIRRADVDAVRNLQGACLPLDYPVSFYTTLMSSSTSACLASFDGHGMPTGFVAVQLIAPPPSLSSPRAEPIPAVYVLALSVSSASRRQGLGARLLRQATAGLVRTESTGGPRKVKLSLHVEVGNEDALAFYRKLGLDVVGTCPRFYRRLRNGGGASDACEVSGIVEGAS